MSGWKRTKRRRCGTATPFQRDIERPVKEHELLFAEAAIHRWRIPTGSTCETSNEASLDAGQQRRPRPNASGESGTQPARLENSLLADLDNVPAEIPLEVGDPAEGVHADRPGSRR